MKKENRLWFFLSLAGVLLNVLLMIQDGITVTTSMNMLILAILCCAFSK